MAMVLGPVLQYRGMVQEIYQVSALVVVNTGGKVSVNPQQPLTIEQIQLIAKVPFDAPRYDIYRIDLSLELHQTEAQFSIEGKSYAFHVPASGAAPRMVFVSCNGFSDPKLMKTVSDKNDRWKDIAVYHKQQPYHLLMMGGDQIYTDQMWKSIESLHNWTDLPLDQRIKAPFTDEMHKGLDALLCSIYTTRWAQPEVIAMLSSVPTIMMWDDHDIFDGWGSYPEELHFSPVYQGIFQLAKRYFHTFQMQLAENDTHPSAIPKQSAYSMGFSPIGNIGILALDLRSERSPAITKSVPPIASQVISPSSWESVYSWIDQQQNLTHLLVISTIPVAYVDFNLLERILATVPGQQELEDDLRDQWRSTAHSQERLRLVHRLLNFSGQKKNACYYFIRGCASCCCSRY